MADNNKNNNQCATQNSNDNHAEALMKGLNAMRVAQKLFDVTLVVEDRVFKAHRVVLAACSDYFCVMFNDFCEANASEIHLKGVNASGIEMLLEYAYTSKLELNVHNVQDVLAASTHVQMNTVTERCSNYLEAQIGVDNFVAIATLADLYALELLKRKVYRFICAQLSELCESPEFLNLSGEQFEYILRSNYPVDCKELRILQIILNYCRKKLLPVYNFKRLLKHIRFGQIVKKELEELVLKNIDEELDENSIKYMKLLYTELQIFYEYYLRLVEDVRICTNSPLLKMFNLKNDEVEINFEPKKKLSPEILINSRGMELALVKIGGFEATGVTNNISCYLRSKGKWQHLTVIPHVKQSNYGTAVLRNNLYVVGGSYDVCLKEYIHPFGFRYCPTKDKWSTIAKIQSERCRFSLHAMGSRYLYAVGGVNESEFDIDDDVSPWQDSNVERYDVENDIWEIMPSLMEDRSNHAGVVVGDKLYISGGMNRYEVFSTLCCFDTKTNRWQSLSPMLTQRADHSLIALDNQIYVCGGWYEDPVTELRVLADTIDVYDIETDQWRTEVHHPRSKFYSGVAAINHRIYFIGGILSNATVNRTTSVVHCYDVSKRKWSRFKEWECPQEVWECTCAALYIPSDIDNMKLKS